MAAFPPLPFKVKALAPYTPTSSTELALVVGQIYEVTSTDGKGVWVQSQVNGVVGWFPFNYTEVVAAAPASAAAAPAAASPRGAPSATPAAESTTALKKKPKKEKRNRPKKPGPALRSHAEKNKKNHPVTVNVQSTCTLDESLLMIASLASPKSERLRRSSAILLFHASVHSFTLESVLTEYNFFFLVLFIVVRAKLVVPDAEIGAFLEIFF